MNQTHPTAAALLGLVPLLIAILTFASMIFMIAPRKGKSRTLALVGVIPLVGTLLLIWIVSLTDKAVLDALDELKRKSA